ncbi:MAG: hypothetical protein QOC61_2277 [Acidobacteriota bacterium]|jgi:hypothetical protein|nr:hypothetical protein [Acidobacteriota bacterium]MDT7781489.1 hypothetical protein [Acidobacteriota bacterium]
MKLFTVEDANALLPTVREIVRKVQRAYVRVSASQESARLAAAGATHGGGGMEGGSAYVLALTALAESSGQLETLGVQIKDYARGLIDFPALREGRVVLLCWQMGEGDELEWWHDLETGFAGRQPL